MLESWPLRHLVLRTPRLALRGVHPPQQMPFVTPWTDQAPDDLVRTSIQYFWRGRSHLTASDWSVNFLVRREGRVIGIQELSGKEFAITRAVFLARPEWTLHVDGLDGCRQMLGAD